MIILIIVIAATLTISMHCSLFEAVLYSTRRAELEAALRAHKHVRQARDLIKMKKTIAGPLASILILNTVANTAGATLAGSLANSVLGSQWVVWLSIGLTMCILVFSEILPKTLGAVYWRFFWPFIVTPLKLLNWILFPFVRMSLALTRVITNKQSSVSVTEDEILAMVRLGAREGEITDMESRMVVNIIGLEERIARDVMTPRTVIYALSAECPADQVYEPAYAKGFNRIPVYENSFEDIRGYVLLKDLARMARHQPEDPIRSLEKAVSFVPENMNCLTLLRHLLKRREQICIVVDEYGGIEGLVTLEDIVEEIIGEEIVDETDRVENLQEQARKLSKFVFKKRSKPTS